MNDFCMNNEVWLSSVLKDEQGHPIERHKMKKIKILCLIYFSMFCLSNSLVAQNANEESTKLETKNLVNTEEQFIKKFSYSFGYSFARGLTEQSAFDASELVEEEILKGIKSGLKVDAEQLAVTNKYLQDRVIRESGTESVDQGKETAYHIGYSGVGNVISTFEAPSSDFDYDSIKKGYSDFIKGNEPQFTNEEMTATVTKYFQDRQIIQQEKKLAELKEEARKNLEAGKKFLAENGKKEGIKTTDSGLQYQIIKEGSGKNPTLEDKVVAHYTGTLMDGKVFDSSIEREKPASFPLTTVIPGWQEAIQLMSVGARFRLFIPAELGFGENNRTSVPPNSVLIFDLELLEIQKSEYQVSDKLNMS